MKIKDIPAYIQGFRYLRINKLSAGPATAGTRYPDVTSGKFVSLPAGRQVCCLPPKAGFSASRNKSNLILLLLLIITATFLRFSQLGRVPPSLFSDEVDLGYQAYSFLKTGKDYFGNSWPISFHSFADFRAPFYIYSAAGTIAIFGLNEWGVRLPAAIFGVLGIITYFLLCFKISKNYYFALLNGLILAIFPWHIHYSRAGFEVSALFCLLSLGLFFFFSFLEKKKLSLLLLSVLFLAFCFYTYATARMFLPLLAIVTLIIYWKQIQQIGIKKFLVAVLVCLFLLLPFAKDSFLGEGLHRFSYLNIFTDSNLKFEINRERLVDATHDKVQTVGMKTPLIAYLFHNKLISWTIEVIRNYVSSFSFDFLFLKGDPNLRHGIGEMGGVLLVFLPFLIIGLFKIFEIIKTKKASLISFKEAVFFLCFALIAPLPAAITYDGGTHATRLFLLVLPLALIISLGIWEFQSWFKNSRLKMLILSLLILFTVINLTYYLHLYYYHYPLSSEKEWHYGYKEGVKLLSEQEADYNKVIISNTYEPPLIFFLFWSKFPPQKFNAGQLVDVNDSWFAGKQLGKYYFGRLNSYFLDSYLPKQYKAQKIEKILILAGRNDFGGDLQKETPYGLKIIDQIVLPSEQPIFYLLRTKTFAEMREAKVK